MLAAKSQGAMGTNATIKALPTKKFCLAILKSECLISPSHVPDGDQLKHAVIRNPLFFTFLEEFPSNYAHMQMIICVYRCILSARHDCIQK